MWDQQVCKKNSLYIFLVLHLLLPKYCLQTVWTSVSSTSIIFSALNKDRELRYSQETTKTVTKNKRGGTQWV